MLELQVPEHHGGGYGQISKSLGNLDSEW